MSRGSLTRDDRADRSLAGTYARNPLANDPGNRKSQFVLVLALCATFVGAFLAVVGNLVGIVLLAVGLPALVATTVWCIRNWDY